MATIKVKRSDLDKFRPVRNLGWKLLEVLSIEGPKPTKTGDSLNYWAQMRVVAPDDEDKGLEFGHCCNTKGAFAVIPFVAAANAKTVDEMFGGSEEVDLELDSTVGKLVEANVGHRVDDNQRVNNDISEWAPAGTNFPDVVGGGTGDDSVPF